MNPPPPSYGTSKDRPASISYAEIEAAARSLMAAGDYASVAAVRGDTTGTRLMRILTFTGQSIPFFWLALLLHHRPDCGNT